FNKGFVRAYARYLGLDEEQAVIDYLAAEGEKDFKRRSPAPSQENRNTSQPQLFAIKGGSRPDNVYNIRASVEVVEQEPAQARGFLMAAVILVFVLGIGGFGWKYYSSHPAAADSSNAVAPQPATPVAQPPAPSPTTSTTTDSTATSAPPTTHNDASATQPSQPIVEKSADAKVLDGTAATKPADSKVANADNKTSIAKTESANSTSAPAASGKFTLDLRADEQSWVQISSEGRVLWSGIVNKDSTKSFAASKELIVKLGNAPGVELSYNGKPLPRFSQEAKTRTLTFTSQGLTPQ